MRRYPGDESLCCCEYIDKNGRQNHLLTCCCDCQALDEAADRLLTCQALPPSLQKQIMSNVQDRCRIPWCNGKGAAVVRMDFVVPIFMVPACLLLATINWQMTAMIIPGMYILNFFFYHFWKRLAGPKAVTKFFFSWALMSVLMCFYVFHTTVVTFREVFYMEILWLDSLALVMFFLLYICKRGPLHIPNIHASYNGHTGRNMNSSSINVTIEDSAGRRKLTMDQDSEEGKGPVIYESDVTWVDSRPFKDGLLVTWCDSCAAVRPPRSGHCTVCQMCVEGRDHHCIWINSCVGHRNHRSFLVAWILLVGIGFYGCYLSLTTICTPDMYMELFMFPSDCRFVYGDMYSALGFVTTIYALSATCFLSCGLLLQQFLLISQNVTNQEFHRARMRGLTKYYFFVQRNVNNKGFFKNWRDFLLNRRRMNLPADFRSVSEI